MPAKVEECCSVRLPVGVKAELVAATGQPFSRIVRFMCMNLLEQKRAERARTPPSPVTEKPDV